MPVRKHEGRVQVLVHNRWQCLDCQDILESKTQHDYQECSCGRVAVDGGIQEGATISGNPKDLRVWRTETKPKLTLIGTEVAPSDPTPVPTPED